MKALLLSLILSAALSTIAHAADVPNYVPIVSIPGVDSSMTIETYIDALFKLSITVAGLIAVVKIIFSGVKWMLSDVITDKSSAKKDIRGAIFGLLIILTAVLVLNTINTNLTVLNIFANAPSIDTITNDTATGSETAIGDTHGLWCGDSSIWSLNPFPSEECQAEYDAWAESCNKVGAVEKNELTGYATCVEK